MIDETLQKKLIEDGRSFMKYSWEDEFGEFESDQDLHKKQPPLVKAPMRPESRRLDLPTDFENLSMNDNFQQLLLRRKSSRVYTQQPVSLLELSFLLWATQGIRDIRGRNYATLRTVPSGGARHGFETYLVINDINDLRPGLWHYLPLTHQIEFLDDCTHRSEIISKTLCDQAWAGKASVVFYWSIIPYRCEWRYGIYAHRVALIDSGYVSENLYLACAALKLGTCAIAALDYKQCTELFELDEKQDEFIFLAQPVGTVREQDLKQEKAFYSFLDEFQ